MAIPANATDFGKLFSELTVSHADRGVRANRIFDAVRLLANAISHEIDAETLATDNAEIDDWDAFRGNGVSPRPSGINDGIQAKGEALWTVLDTLTT